MDSEIIGLIDSIKERTGEVVRVYIDDGDEFYSPIDGEKNERAKGKITGVEPVSEGDKTYFKFRFRTDEYVGYIRKTGDDGKTLASFVCFLFENGGKGETPTSKKDALKSILLGERSVAQANRDMRKFGVPEAPCSAFVVYIQDGRAASDLVDFLENFKTGANDIVVAIDDFACAYVRFSDVNAQDGEFPSLADFAYLIAQSVEEELGISVRVGVGSTVDGFADSAVSYKQATTAIRMSGLFESNAKAATYKDYVLVKMLEDLPRYKLEEFLNVLSEPETKNVFADAEMLETATEFLKSNLNVSEASRNLFMHRNTLMYRLDKIERATGLDIRKFRDAMTFRLITILYKLLG